MASIRVPVDLIDQLVKGNCVFFIGPGIYEGKDGCPPNRQELASELTRLCDYPDENIEIAKIAQFYEDNSGRPALVNFLISKFDSPQYKPQLIQQLCANLPIKTFVTTNYDTLLEGALTNTGKAYVKIASDKEVSFIDEAKTNIIKLHGDIQQKDTLIITRDDYSDFFAKHPSIAEVLGVYAATKTLVFLGYALDDYDSQNIFLEVTRNLGKYRRQAYAVQFKSSLVDKKYWRNKGITFLETEGIEFLSGITESWTEAQSKLVLSEKRHASSSDQAHKESPDPYKFLDFYEAEESDLFFGRDTETRQFIQKILSHRVSILVGKSGTGKTSLIKAGIIPKLSSENFLLIYARCDDSPVQSIVRSVSSQPNLKYKQQVDESGLAGFLSGLMNHSLSSVIVFLDQFEEIFTRTDVEARQDFIKELAHTIEICGNGIRFVLSMREDFLTELYQFNAVIPRIMANTFVLGNLSYEGASAAINNPLKPLGMEIDSELVERILDDLNRGTIYPPQLQIVCQKLYENRELTSNRIDFETYLRLGGANIILAEYLDMTLAHFPEHRRLIAKDLLKHMVESIDTKHPLRVSEVGGKEEVESVLSNLINYRLVRVVKIMDEKYYELAHEYMIQKIIQWFNEEELAVQDVMRLLDQEFENWQRYQLLISNKKLEILFRKHENPYFKVDEAEVKLIIESCLYNGTDKGFPDWLSQIKVWLAKAESLGLSQLELLKERLVDPNSDIRKRTVQAISSSLGYRAVNELLSTWTSEKDPKVREAILIGLGEIHPLPPNAVNILIQGLEDPYPSVQFRAREALKNVDDAKSQEVLKNYQAEGMVLIPQGEFWMGSDVELDERPKHLHSLNSFYIDRYPVTNAAYAKFIEVTGYTPPSHWKGASFPPEKADYPVDNVTLEDAKCYAQWAGKRLPTEFEWEKAARGTDGREWPWGNTYDPEKCNVDSDDAKPVGSYSPEGDSPFGVGDTSGNIMEWTISRYEPYERTDTYKGFKNRYGLGYVVVRGGGFRETERASRCSARRTEFQDAHRTGLGFRCAVDL